MKPRKNKTLVWIALAGLLMAGISGCRQTTPNKQKDEVTVSILPYQFFVKKIAGDQFNIEVMIPPGASPASYEPTPRQMMNLAASDLYFLSGHLAFEKNLAKSIQSNLPQLKLVDTSQELELIEQADDAQSHHGHHHGPVEPHVWTSPRNVKKIAQHMALEFVNAYPQNKAMYQANLEKFIHEIDSIDLAIENLLSPVQNRSFIIYHPALSYFAADYNLNQISIEQHGKEPSVKHIKEIADFALQNQIRLILVQKQFNVNEAETLAQEIGGKIIVIDPLAFNWNKEMIYIAKQLAQNL